MKRDGFRICLFAACAMFAFGCGDSNDSGNNNASSNGNASGKIVSVENRTVSGVSQKGPFVTGSSVAVQELNGESLLQTGISFKGKITNDKGEFKVASINLASQYALLEVTGYYRNEVTGQNSNSMIMMNALADISDRENVNINLLTHLETDRVMHLVTVDGKSFDEAKKQAREELLGYFGFDGNFGASEDMSIFGQNDDAAALLAISIIVQGNLSESLFTERLARIAGDIADGTIDNTEIWQQMATDAMAQSPRRIRQNVENWGEQVPDFEKYLRAFWRDRLGLGTCDRVGAIQQYKNNGISLACREDGWDKANMQDILNETIGVCDKDGTVKYIYYIFDGYTWDYEDYIYNIYPKMGYVICRNGQWENANQEEILNHELGVCDKNGTEKTFCNYVEIAKKQENWYEYYQLERGRYICAGSGWKYADGSYSSCDNYDGGDCNDGVCCRTDEIYINGVCTSCGNGICDTGEEEYCPQDCNNGDYCGECIEGVVECEGDASIRYCVSHEGCGRWMYEDCSDGMMCVNDGECVPRGSSVCGNGICDPGETSISCSVDCKSKLEEELGVCNGDNSGEVKEHNGDNYYVCEGNKWQRTDEAAFVNHTLGPCNDDILDEVRGVYLEHKFGMIYYACRGYGSERRWERVENYEVNGMPCKSDDIAPAAGCYICLNNQWTSNINDILNEQLGVCDYEGDIKKYDRSGKCNLFPGGQYLVCRNGIWDKLEDSRVPPGSCQESVGTKRRIEGVCYVCGEDKKWQSVDCE